MIRGEDFQKSFFLNFVGVNIVRNTIMCLAVGIGTSEIRMILR